MFASVGNYAHLNYSPTLPVGGGDFGVNVWPRFSSALFALWWVQAPLALPDPHFLLAPPKPLGSSRLGVFVKGLHVAREIWEDIADCLDAKEVQSLERALGVEGFNLQSQALRTRVLSLIRNILPEDEFLGFLWDANAVITGGAALQIAGIESWELESMDIVLEHGDAHWPRLQKILEANGFEDREFVLLEGGANDTLTPYADKPPHSYPVLDVHLWRTASFRINVIAISSMSSLDYVLRQYPTSCAQVYLSKSHLGVLHPELTFAGISVPSEHVDWDVDATVPDTFGPVELYNSRGFQPFQIGNAFVKSSTMVGTMANPFPYRIKVPWQHPVLKNAVPVVII